MQVTFLVLLATTLAGCASKPADGASPPGAAPHGLPPLTEAEHAEAQRRESLIPALPVWTECIAYLTARQDTVGQFELIADLVVEAGASEETGFLLRALGNAAAGLHASGARTRALTIVADAMLRLDDTAAARALVDAAATTLKVPTESPDVFDVVDQQRAMLDAARIYASLAVHDRVQELTVVDRRAVAGAALGYALAGDTERCRGLVAGVRADTYPEQLAIVRIYGALGDERAVKAAVLALEIARRGEAWLAVAADAVTMGAPDRARTALARATEVLGNAPKGMARVSGRFLAAKLWAKLGDGEQAKAALARGQAEIEGVGSMYRSAFLSQLAETRAAAGDVDGAMAFIDGMGKDALAHLGPIPLTLIDLQTRQGKFEEAAKTLSAHTIAADSYAIALIYVRYRQRARRDARFETEMERTLSEYYCSRR